MLQSPIGRLRFIAFVEGISYLVLVCIAMPLKYFWAMPQAVRIFGMAHGALFLLFCAALIIAALEHNWRLSRVALVFASSLVPFGTFAMDGSLKREAAAAPPST